MLALPGQAADSVFLTMGVEGAARPAWTTPRTPRWPAWIVGELARVGDCVDVRTSATGLVDYGLFYAGHSFVDAEGRRVLWGAQRVRCNLIVSLRSTHRLDP